MSSRINAELITLVRVAYLEVTGVEPQGGQCSAIKFCMGNKTEWKLFQNSKINQVFGTIF